MTARHAEYQLEQALSSISFEEHDICHQISQICDDYDQNTIDDVQLDCEIEGLIEEQKHYLIYMIKDEILKQIKTNN